MTNKHNYTILHRTASGGVKIELDGTQFWACEAWIEKDGRLGEKALKAFKKAKDLSEGLRKEAKSNPVVAADVLDGVVAASKSNVEFSKLVLTYLTALCDLLALLFEHEKMQNPQNKIYAIDVRRHIAKQLTNLNPHQL